MPNQAGHWDAIYGSKREDQLSWTQREPGLSLALITAIARGGRVIDIGGGISPLAHALAQLGYSVTVADISRVAIERAPAEPGVTRIVADVTANPELGRFDIWHDRAVFHFLMEAPDREAYAALLRKSIAPGGHAVIATFAPDGPDRCSGLPVRRYDAESLAAALGEGWKLRKSVAETHLTPWGAPQKFQYSVLERC